jgi:hypothetical protein
MTVGDFGKAGGNGIRTTLRRWLRDYGEERIRASVPGVRYFFNGNRRPDGTEGANRRYLSSWEWQSFTPFEVAYPMCLP